MASKTEYLNLHLYSEEDPFTILGEENSLNGNMQIIDNKFNEIDTLEKIQIVNSLPFQGEDDTIYLLDTTTEAFEAPIVPDMVYYVAASGIDASGTGTRENPWKLVRKAIEVANNIYAEGQIVEVRILGGNWSPFELTTPLPKHKFTLLLTQEDSSQPIGSALVSVLMISGPTIFKNICMQMSSTAGIICLRGYDCTIKESSSVKGPYQSELAVFDWGSNTSTSQMEHTQSPQIKIEYGIDLVRIGNRDGYDKFSGQIDIIYDAPEGKPIFHLGTSLQSNNLITTTTTYAPINITILNAASIRWKYVKKLAFAGSNSGLQVINATNNSFQYADIDALKTNSLITEANRDKVWIYHTSGIKNTSVEFTNIVGELKCNDKIIATNTDGEVFASTDTDIIHLAPGEYVLSYATKENLLDGYVWKNGYYQRILDKTIPASNIIDQNYNPLSEYGQSGKAVAEAIKQAQLQASEGIGVGLMIEDKGEVFNNYSDNTALGKYSHAEGNKTSAIGNYSHAEGTETQALGTDSHAEGFATVAAGEFSHAGGYQTLAGHSYQSVCGYYNLNQEDTLFEIGNGTPAKGQNAFEVRKDGSAKLGGARENEPNAVVTADFMMKHIHPIGSLWIGGKDNSGEKIHPATLFGGTWELVDKTFQTTWITMDSSYWTASNAIMSNGVAGLCGNEIILRLSLSPSVALSDDTIELGTLQVDKIGVTNFVASNMYHVAISDGGQCTICYTLNDQGKLTVSDVLNINDKHTMAAGQSFYINLVLPITKDKMLDDFCDRFYWQRTA